LCRVIAYGNRLYDFRGGCPEGVGGVKMLQQKMRMVELAEITKEFCFNDEFGATPTRPFGSPESGGGKTHLNTG